MNIIISVFAFLFGLAVGSFLNVVICRLETKESFIKSRSHCPYCKTILKWYELIPVFSFLFQKAKCLHCKKSISWQYPLVELSTGIVFLLFFNQVLSSGLINLFYYLTVSCFLIVIFVFDLKHYLILNKVLYPAIIISFIFIIGNHFINQLNLSLPSPQSGLAALLVASGFFLFLVLISKNQWMGWGDVKLAVLMGLILGWPNILLALFLSFLSGAIVGISLILFGKKGLKSQIPFGPFLVGSTLWLMLVAPCLPNWYQSLFYF